MLVGSPKPKIRKAPWPAVVALGAKYPIIPSNYWYGDFDDRTGKYEFNKTTAISKKDGGNGLYDAVRGDEAALNALWNRASRWVGAGIRTGAAPNGSGFDLLDIDLQWPEAEHWWEANGHRFPRTPTVCTPSGGLHLYLRHREGQGGVVGCPVKGIDVRGHNGLCWAWFLNGFPCENFDMEPADWPDVPEIPLLASSEKKKAKPKAAAHFTVVPSSPVTSTAAPVASQNKDGLDIPSYLRRGANNEVPAGPPIQAPDLPAPTPPESSIFSRPGRHSVSVGIASGLHMAPPVGVPEAGD